MKKKLTLRLDEDLIQRAKKEAERRGKSVSQMVADFFTVLEQNRIDEGDGEELSEYTRSMIGSIEGVDEGDYYDYLEEKHR